MLHCLLEHFLINGTNFGEGLLNKTRFPIFLQVLFKNSHSDKILSCYCHKFKQVFMQITRFLIIIHSYLNLWTNFCSLEI